MNKIIKYNPLKKVFPFKVFPLYDFQKRKPEKKDNLIKKESVDNNSCREFYKIKIDLK